MIDTDEKSAVLSPCLRFRYLLKGAWLSDAAAPGTVCFIGLNPSTADAEVDGSTIRRMCGFASHLGFASIAVVNLCPIRATNPKRMLKMAASKDPRYLKAFAKNDEVVKQACREVVMVIPRWGNHDHA